EGYRGGAAGVLVGGGGEGAARPGGGPWSLLAHPADWTGDRKINTPTQSGPRRSPLIPEVPLLQDLLASERERQIAAVIGLPPTVGPGYWMAPGVPDEALAIVRKAFEAMIADPAFAASARQVKLDVNPKTA